MDDVTLGKLLTEAHRGQADYCEPEGVSVSQSSSSVVFDGSGNLMEREMSINQLVLVSQETRTVLIASFLKTPELRKWSRDMGNLRSEIAQMHRLGTLLEEQRQMIIAEYREKVDHHELQAAQAEEERRLLQGQLWQQKLEYREAHQRSLTEMEELRKFQSSTFDTMARRKFIEDQNTILGTFRQSTRNCKMK